MINNKLLKRLLNIDHLNNEDHMERMNMKQHHIEMLGLIFKDAVMWAS